MLSVLSCHDCITGKTDAAIAHKISISLPLLAIWCNYGSWQTIRLLGMSALAANCGPCPPVKTPILLCNIVPSLRKHADHYQSRIGIIAAADTPMKSQPCHQPLPFAAIHCGRS